MSYMILVNGKPMKNVIDRKIVTFETREQAEAMVVNHRLTFSQPRTFSNTLRRNRYEVRAA